MADEREPTAPEPTARAAGQDLTTPSPGRAAGDDGWTADGPADADVAEPVPADVVPTDDARVDGTVIDDPDEPVHPDEAAVAETEAARAALSSTAPRRKYRGPRSIPIMLFVVALVVATGVYAVSWYQRIKEADDRGDLRKLEEREVMARFQRRSTLLRFGPDAKVLPAGVVYEPPTPAERGKMRQLQQRFGPNQFKPDDKQNMLIQEVHELEAARGLPPTSLDVSGAPPATGPATGGTPATTGAAP